jgi:cell shape-determining protein MreD
LLCGPFVVMVVVAAVMAVDGWVSAGFGMVLGVP